MVTNAADLTDHVLPLLPVRQRALAVPKRQCNFLHRDNLPSGCTEPVCRA
jgi:hypothetical protein